MFTSCATAALAAYWPARGAGAAARRSDVIAVAWRRADWRGGTMRSEWRRYLSPAKCVSGDTARSTMSTTFELCRQKCDSRQKATRDRIRPSSQRWVFRVRPRGTRRGVGEIDSARGGQRNGVGPLGHLGHLGRLAKCRGGSAQWSGVGFEGVRRTARGGFVPGVLWSLAALNLRGRSTTLFTILFRLRGRTVGGSISTVAAAHFCRPWSHSQLLPLNQLPIYVAQTAPSRHIRPVGPTRHRPRPFRLSRSPPRMADSLRATST
jgi:hypothetical protein